MKDYIQDLIDEYECRLESRKNDLLEYNMYINKFTQDIEEIEATLKRLKSIGLG